MRGGPSDERLGRSCLRMLVAPRSTILKKMGASEYAEEINGLQINPLRRLRLRRLMGISLCCKFLPTLSQCPKVPVLPRPILPLARCACIGAHAFYKLRDRPL